MSSAAQRRSIVGIDLIRFTAALLVVLYHLCFSRNGLGPPPGVAFVGNLVWFGWIGVQIFFVISGFVIAFSMTGTTASTFLKHRVIRLYPAVWICATITLAVMLISSHQGLKLLSSSYLCSMSLWPRGKNIDGVYWTLQVEVMFYALCYVCLLFKRADLMPVAISIIGGISSIFWISNSMIGVFHLRGAGGVEAKMQALHNSHTFEMLLLNHGGFFTIGVLLCGATRAKISVRDGLIFALCFIGCLCEIKLFVADQQLRSHFSLHTAAVAPAAAWLLAIAAIIASVKYNNAIHTNLKGSLHVLRFMGLMTYPLYLIHDAPGLYFETQLMAHGASGKAAVLISLVLVLGMAGIITAYAEPIVRSGLRKVLGVSQGRISPVPTATLVEGASSGSRS